MRRKLRKFSRQTEKDSVTAVFQTVDNDPGSHSRIRVFVHNKFCNIVEILTFLVEFTV